MIFTSCVQAYERQYAEGKLIRKRYFTNNLVKSF